MGPEVWCIRCWCPGPDPIAAWTASPRQAKVTAEVTHTTPISGRLLELWRYPVSSLAGEALARAQVGPQGVFGDRTHAFYENGSDQIATPSIFKRWNIAPSISARRDAQGAIQISFDQAIWHGQDDADMLDRLAAMLGVPARLCRYGDPVGGGIAASRYQLHPIHLVSRQALQRLQATLPGSDIDRRRFRPNMVVDLPDLPGLMPEYALIGQEFSIGGLRLRGVSPCGRCSFTTLPQQNLPEDRDVLRALIQGYEKNFGIYCEVLGTQDVALDDPLQADIAAPPIVIVGAGQAGAMTAKALRELGATQAICLIGDERHAPYERPPLSKAVTSDGAALKYVLTPAQIDDLDLDLRLNQRVARIDRDLHQVQTESGQVLPYHRLVLATGGTARRPAQGDRGFGRIHAIRTAEDAMHLQAALRPGLRLGIVGGGWLGLEVAAAARALTCEVTIYARQSRLCARQLPVEVTDVLQARHRAAGVTLRLGHEPVLRETADAVLIDTPDGTQQMDLVLVAIGIDANDHLARAAGLEVAQGIVTDVAGRTSVPGIFAVGDVARQSLPGHPGGQRIESWHNANDQALRAARAILGLPDGPLAPVRFWSEQYDMMLQIAGFPDPDAALIDSQDTPEQFWNYGSFAVGINCPRRMHRFAADMAPPVTDAPDPAAPTPTGTTPHSIGASDRFPEGQIVRIDLDGTEPIAVVRQNGMLFAVSDKCPHADASLAEGFVEAGRIVCPLHFAEFSLTSGQPGNAPPGCGRINCYRIEERDGAVVLMT